MEITEDETNWSLDIKRSVLSLLQLHLSAPDYTITQNLPYNQLQQQNVTTFDVLESGLDGTCYSSVHVYALPHQPNYYRVCNFSTVIRSLYITCYKLWRCLIHRLQIYMCFNFICQPLLKCWLSYVSPCILTRPTHSYKGTNIFCNLSIYYCYLVYRW